MTCGPVVYGGTPREFIGDPGELSVAAPDAFYKIVVKENPNGKLDVLAFLIPQHGRGNYGSTNHPLTPYLTSVDTIEALTGLDFLTNVEDAEEDELERTIPIALWSMDYGDVFGRGGACRIDDQIGLVGHQHAA